MPAKGSAEWKGDLKGGAGTFTAGDGISGDYSFKSRFEDGPGANPEQLIAAVGSLETLGSVIELRSLLQA